MTDTTSSSYSSFPDGVTAPSPQPHSHARIADKQKHLVKLTGQDELKLRSPLVRSNESDQSATQNSDGDGGSDIDCIRDGGLHSRKRTNESIDSIGSNGGVDSAGNTSEKRARVSPHSRVSSNDEKKKEEDDTEKKFNTSAADDDLGDENYVVNNNTALSLPSNGVVRENGTLSSILTFTKIGQCCQKGKPCGRRHPSRTSKKSTNDNNNGVYNEFFGDDLSEGRGEEVDEDIAEEDGSGKEGEEQWDLTKIMTVEELKMPSPQLCSYANDEEKKCKLLACSKYERKGAEPWYSCLDCQQEDYDGWPEDKAEYPTDHLTEEHRHILQEKCSEDDSPAMPNLPFFAVGTPFKDRPSFDEEWSKVAHLYPVEKSDDGHIVWDDKRYAAKVALLNNVLRSSPHAEDDDELITYEIEMLSKVNKDTTHMVRYGGKCPIPSGGKRGGHTAECRGGCDEGYEFMDCSSHIALQGINNSIVQVLGKSNVDYESAFGPNFDGSLMDLRRECITGITTTINDKGHEKCNGPSNEEITHTAWHNEQVTALLISEGIPVMHTNVGGKVVEKMYDCMCENGVTWQNNLVVMCTDGTGHMYLLHYNGFAVPRYAGKPEYQHRRMSMKAKRTSQDVLGFYHIVRTSCIERGIDPPPVPTVTYFDAICAQPKLNFVGTSDQAGNARRAMSEQNSQAGKKGTMAAGESVARENELDAPTTNVEAARLLGMQRAALMKGVDTALVDKRCIKCLYVNKVSNVTTRDGNNSCSGGCGKRNCHVGSLEKAGKKRGHKARGEMFVVLNNENECVAIEKSKNALKNALKRVCSNFVDRPTEFNRAVLELIDPNMSEVTSFDCGCGGYKVQLDNFNHWREGPP